jgi:autotransporter-associated beta strand protein
MASAISITGATTIRGGVLETTTLADGGVASGIGSSASTSTNLVINGGTLKYTAAATSTDRLFKVGETTTGGTATIDASGTGAISFTNIGAITYGTAGSTGTPQTRSLVLTGSNTGDNTLSATIGNNGIATNGNSAVSVTKSGIGKWILSGINAYTGNTTVSGGTLSLGQATLADASTVNVASSAVLNLTHGLTDTVDSFYINGVLQQSGEWGAIGSGAAHQTARITGSGKLYATNGTVSSEPYVAWIDSFSGITDPADKAKTADPDNDGLTNFVEFALDGNPASGTVSGKVRSRIETVGVDQALVITLPVRAGAAFDNTPGPAADATIDNLTYTIQGSNDLVTFGQGVTEIPVSSSGMPDLSSASWAYKTFRLDGAIGGGTPRGPKGFLRVMVVSTP